MNYCPEIYKGLFLDPRDQDVRVSPCCNMQGPAVQTVDFHNNEFLNQLRQENTKGIRSTACNACWRIEDAGGRSRRIDSQNFFLQNVAQTESTNVELLTLDYNVTWACNLACVMCYPEFSSRWAKELGVSKDINRAQKIKNNVLLQADLSKLKKIHFNGGEPLINNEHLQVLERVSALDKLYVSYNTNGTFYPDNRVIELWEKCHSVRILFSIDAIGDASDYIRWPSQWEQIEKNIEKMKNSLPSNVSFGINATIGSYNVLEIPDVYKWYTKNLIANKDGHPGSFHWQPALNYHPKYLNTDIKQECLNKLKEYKELESLYNFIQQDIDIISSNISWINDLDKIDARRGTNWKTSLEIGKYYK